MKNILVLGIGNELLSDDGVGILAVRKLARELRGQADVVETALHGLALLELFLGHRQAIVIDAICTGAHPHGTVFELNPADLETVESPSPHYTGLPEMLALAKQLNLDFPADVKIIAMEVVDPFTVGFELSEPVQKALPELIRKVLEQVKAWIAAEPLPAAATG
jgi:hydrogenase maturation protease